MKDKRDRAWRRKQAHRIVANRMRKTKAWNWPIDKPGYLKKWNLTCSCYICKNERYSRCQNKRITKEMTEQEYY